MDDRKQPKRAIDDDRAQDIGTMKLQSLSRRDFLKMASAAGAVVGMGAGLGGILAGCGEEETASTTIASSATTSAPASATTATTVSAEAEMGREIKVGFPSPQTGPIATFGVPDAYCAERWLEAYGDGIVCGDGKKHPINIIIRDTQSDSNRVAQVTADLINNDKVDIVIAASSPETVCPSADQAEALETPYIAVDCPIESFWVSRAKDPKKDTFKWTYLAFWSLYQHADAFMETWDRLNEESIVKHNKVVGIMFPNDADGNGDRTVWPARLESRGYKMVDAGPYQNGTEDFSSIVSLFKGEGCEIVFGDMIPPDFVNWWKQCIQQGFRPKIPSMAKAILFPEAVESAGEIAYGYLGDANWGTDWPFKSSLTGETCPELAADFEKRQNRQWTLPVGMHYPLGEWLYDVYRRCPNVDDKNEIVVAIKTTHVETISGGIHFNEPVAPGVVEAGRLNEGRHIYENAYCLPFCVGQWVKGEKYPFEFYTVDASLEPEITPSKEYQLVEDINPAYK